MGRQNYDPMMLRRTEGPSVKRIAEERWVCEGCIPLGGSPVGISFFRGIAREVRYRCKKRPGIGMGLENLLILSTVECEVGVLPGVTHERHDPLTFY